MLRWIVGSIRLSGFTELVGLYIYKMYCCYSEIHGVGAAGFLSRYVTGSVCVCARTRARVCVCVLVVVCLFACLVVFVFCLLLFCLFSLFHASIN